ncbi:hypothetical protein Taro_021031 [Colocasia esculenta]|uniref:Uncharacterized protein n=1 Tax=Colocasia esculenta TaxID=4460 RepID=A0A843V3U5_COLES|nr:hypothetical protein [Colocasia esculenta]
MPVLVAFLMDAPETPEEVNAEFFQEDLVEDVELTTHTGVDESEEPICLSKGNEVEEVNPHEIKGSSGRRTYIDVGQVSGEDYDEEEEYTSDECENDDEDEAELDISFWSFFCDSSSGSRFGSVYTSSSYSSSFWAFFCASSSGSRLGSVYTSSSSYNSRPSVSAPPAFLAGASTVSEAEDAVSLLEGGDSFYDGTLREYGQGDDCDNWKLTEFNSDSWFEFGAQIHIKQVSLV